MSAGPVFAARSAAASIWHMKVWQKSAVALAAVASAGAAAYAARKEVQARPEVAAQHAAASAPKPPAAAPTQPQWRPVSETVDLEAVPRLNAAYARSEKAAKGHGDAAAQWELRSPQARAARQARGNLQEEIKATAKKYGREPRCLAREFASMDAAVKACGEKLWALGDDGRAYSLKIGGGE